MRISDWSSDVCSSDLGGDPAGIDRAADEVAGALFGAQVDGRRRAFLAAEDFAQPHRLAEVAGAFADREDDVAGALEADADRLVHILDHADAADRGGRSEEHTSELQSIMRISYAVFCLKK